MTRTSAKRRRKEFAVELVPLDKLLAESDFVSLHTALSPGDAKPDQCGDAGENEKGRVSLLTPRAGELIEEAALAEALKSGHIGGAGLDVFAEEPPKNSPLVGLPNVMGTPHIAGSTAEAQEEVGTQVAVQVKDYLAEGIIQQRGEFTGAFGGAVSPRAAVPAIGGAAGIAGVAGVGDASIADSHSLRGRSGGSGDTFVAQRGARGSLERGAG